MHVEMPALVFGGPAPAPPPGTDAQTMLLVGEIRVQPGIIYQGVVADATNATSKVPAHATLPAPTAPQSAATASSTKNETKSQKPGFWARLFGGHKHLPRCAGVGCPASN